MLISLPDARSLPDEVLEALRLRAIRGCQLGFAQTDLAELLGVACEIVSRWWSAYCVEGLEGLPGDRTGRPSGSGRTLSPEQETHLQELIDHNTPEDLEIAAPLWNRRAVQELIRKETGIGMSVRTVGLYLKRWGYTCKKSRRHHRKQDLNEVNEWLEKTYPDLEKKAQTEGATIFWGDETGVAADAFPGYGYARKGVRVTLEVPDPHITMNGISAISNEGSIRFMTHRGGQWRVLSGFRSRRRPPQEGELCGLERDPQSRPFSHLRWAKCRDSQYRGAWSPSRSRKIRNVRSQPRSPARYRFGRSGRLWKK